MSSADLLEFFALLFIWSLYQKSRMNVATPSLFKCFFHRKGYGSLISQHLPSWWIVIWRSVYLKARPGSRDDFYLKMSIIKTYAAWFSSAWSPNVLDQLHPHVIFSHSYYYVLNLCYSLCASFSCECIAYRHARLGKCTDLKTSSHWPSPGRCTNRPASSW